MKTIMVVDDEEDVQITVKNVFEKKKYKVVAASDGEECLKQLSKIKADIILLDVMMPKMTTKEILKRLRQDDSKKDIKVVLFTVVLFTEEEKEQLLKLNSNVKAFVQKPFEVKDLVNTVKKLVG